MLKFDKDEEKGQLKLILPSDTLVGQTNGPVAVRLLS
jgi:hypothetical protein